MAADSQPTLEEMRTIRSQFRPDFYNNHLRTLTESSTTSGHSVTSSKQSIRHEKFENFYNEAYFTELIALEVQRTYRSVNPFMLVFIDVRKLVENRCEQQLIDGITRLRVVDLVIKTLYESTREIDIKGWMCRNQVIGILCTEINKKSCEIIVNKIRRNLISAIDKCFYEDIEIRWKLFPVEDPDSDKTRVISLKDLTDDVPVSGVTSHPASKKTALFFKRAIDILGSLFAILFFSPFFLFISLLIKLTSKGPILFRQERVGEGGKTFTLLKFRSMYANNNEEIHKKFVSKLINGEIKVEEGKVKNAFKMKDDPRVTYVGKFIRKTSLDELPQFFNVLRGDMSLVGPRPPIPYEVEEYDTWHTKRVLDFKPGITGYWQVDGRSNTDFNNMVRMDIHYMKNWSLWLDLKLLFKTPIAVLVARGAC